MRKLALIGIALSLSACTTVEPGHMAVKVTLGKMADDTIPPGFVMFNPLLDQIREYDCRQLTVEGKCVPLTADQQPITVDYKVQYRVPESQVRNLVSKFNGDPYDKLVDPQVQEAFRQTFSQYKADVALKNLGTVRQQVLSIVREALAGTVDVHDLPITHVELPETLQKAIAEKQVVEQEALKKNYELEKAKREADIKVAQASAEARSIELQAKAQAKAIQLKSQALSKTPLLIEYERVQRWNGVLPTINLGNGSGMSAMPLLHLNKDLNN